MVFAFAMQNNSPALQRGKKMFLGDETHVPWASKNDAGKRIKAKNGDG